MTKPLVGILMGSDSDLPIMQETGAMLQEFGIEYEMTIASAHRTPKKVLEYSQGAERRGIKVIIAGAGSAAHLAGVIASHTTLPVIGVPIDSSALKGLDALLSTVQMPGGIPVATMSIGKAGAKNAGIFAAQIIGVSDVKVANRLKVYKVEMERDVEEKAKKIVASSTIATTPARSASSQHTRKAVAAPIVEVPVVAEEEHAAEQPAAAIKKKPRRRRWKKKTGTAPAQGQPV